MNLIIFSIEYNLHKLKTPDCHIIGTKAFSVGDV